MKDNDEQGNKKINQRITKNLTRALAYPWEQAELFMGLGETLIGITQGVTINSSWIFLRQEKGLCNWRLD